MSGELVPSQPGFIARAKDLGLTKQKVEEYVATPLRMLPESWRVPTWAFWTFFSDLLPDQLSLSARLRHWANDGLTLDDLGAIYERLTAPAEAARFEYKGQLMAELSRLVGDRLARKRKMAEMLDRRKDDAAWDALDGTARDLGKIPDGDIST